MEQNPISLPLSPLEWLGGILAGICLSAGSFILWGSLEILARSALSFLVCLPYVAVALAFCIGGAVGLVNSFLTVRLTPGGMELTAFGRVFRRYPLEQLQTFALVQRGVAKSQTSHLCVCTKTVAELADLRAAKIRADDRSRRLAARRQHATWQEAFAGDHLRRRVRTHFFTLPGRDMFWLGCNLETIGLLRLAYPEVPWLILPEAQSSPMRYANDSAPTRSVFAGGKAAIVFDENGAVLEQNGRQTKLLAADAVRTIICTENLCAGGGYYQKFLLLTSHAPEELIGTYKRRHLDRLKLLKNWRLLALNQACCARMPPADPWGNGKDLVSVYWHPARESALRQLFPQAAFFDCSHQALFDAVFHPE